MREDVIWVCNCHNQPIDPVRVDSGGTTRPKCRATGKMLRESQIHLKTVGMIEI